MRFNVQRPASLLLISLTFSVTLLLLAIPSCGRRGGISPASLTEGASEVGIPDRSVALVPLEVVVAEIDGLSYDGPRQSLFKRLKGELKDKLISKRAGRIASLPPLRSRDKVTDLSATRNLDETFTLGWSYRNTGDYSQDGIASIQDITPIAEHFFHRVGDDPLDEVVDGSGDGSITIQDITPLAENFLSQVWRYSVRTSPTETGDFTEVASVSLSEGTGEGRLRFTKTLEGLTPGNYVMVVPMDVAESEGIASNVVRLPTLANTPPTASVTADPTEGDAPLLVNFDASGSSDADGSVVSYEWDFEGDGTYDEQGTSPTTSHTYDLPRELPYDATVRVTDNAGATDTASVQILVTTSGDPPVINSLIPLTGMEDDYVTFLADVSGTPPFDFFFEFDTGSVTPDFVEGSGDTVEASVTLGAPGDRSVTIGVSNLIGSAERTFTFTIISKLEVRGDWWMVGRDSTHQGRSPFTGPQLSDSFLWKFQKYGTNVSPGPAIAADGTIYIGGFDTAFNTYLYAINPDGTQRWRFQTESLAETISESPAIGRDATIYFPAGPYLYALDSDGVTNLWKFSAGGPIFSSPAISEDGIIYFGCSDDKLYAVLPTGELYWTFVTGGDVSSDPAVGSDGTIYVGSNDGYLYAVNADGSLKWSAQTDGAIRGGPAVVTDPVSGDETAILVGTTVGSLYSLTLQGAVNWTLAVGGGIVSTPAVGYDGTVYIGAQDFNLYAVNPDGTEKWRFSTGAELVASPAIGGDGTVYIGSTDYNLYAIAPDGSEKWRYTTGYSIISPLAIGNDGTLYVNSGDTYIYAFRDIPPEPPVAFLSAEPTESLPPVLVNFDASLSYDPDGTIVKYEWDWEGDGIYDYDSGTNPVTSHPYMEPGIFDATVRVTDNEDFQDTEFVTITILEPPNELPVADVQAMPTFGKAPLQVQFDGSGSYDPDGLLVFYEWDWEGDGIYDDSGDDLLAVMHTYTDPGIYDATLRVTDNRDATATDSVTIYVSSTNQGDWWMFGRNPRHESRSPFTGPMTNNVRWSLEVGRVDRSSAALAGDGTIYIGSQDNKLYAINPLGGVKWVYDQLADGVFSGPAVGTDGTIYFGTRDGDRRFIALNDDGTLKWDYATPGFVHSSPAVGDDGTIYFGVGDLDAGVENWVYALNSDGTLKWRYQTGGYVNSSPAISPDGTVYVGSNDNNLYAFDPADGTVLWNFTASDIILSSPTLAGDGTIYFGSSDGYLYALDPADMGTDYKWRYQTGDAIWSKPAVGADGTVYFGSWDGFFYAINPDGTLSWSYDAGEKIYSSPAVGANGVIYFGTYNITDGRVIALSSDGSFLWSYNVGAEVTGGLTIGEGGVLYVGANDFNGDDFYAFSDT